MKLLEKSKMLAPSEKLTGKNSNFRWLLDAGASYHMTGSAHLLVEDKEALPPVAVILPNGEVKYATSVGSVKLSSYITLRKVLFVPGLKCNLISVAHLIDDQKCDVYFTNQLCVIHDYLPTRMLIGAGRRQDGVYYFHGFDTTTASQIRKQESSNLWHSRLGHPSSKVMSCVFSLNNFGSVSDLNKVCDACLRGKQTREVFQTNNTR
ncbi:unnamed protein product, partial [Cuscuta europaea]